MSRFTYEINEDNVLKMWDAETVNEDNDPFLLQPTWPNGDAWGSKSEIETWAKAMIASLEDPNSKFIPGNSASEPVIPRPKPTVLPE